MGAALLSEQAGFALLNAGTAHVRGGLVRKFGFQMVMAGSLYRTSGLERHALRCLASVVNLFHDRGWPAAEQHLSLQIGSLALALKDDATALRFRGRVLERGMTGPVLKHHATVVKDWADCLARLKPASLRLALPRVIDEGARLCEPPSVAGGASELGELDGVLAKALNLGRVPKVRVAYAGEALLVTVALHNPLLCALPVQALRLAVAPGCRVLESEGESLELAPLETRRVALAVTPTHAGDALAVVGLRWRVMGLSAELECAFERRGALLNDTRQQIRERARAPDVSLSAQVAAPAPFLALRCTPLDASAGPEPSGAKFSFALEMTNTGSVVADNLLAAYAPGPAGQCGVEWTPAAEVLSEHVCRLPVRALQPGESAALRFTVLASTQPTELVIKYGARVARLPLAVPAGPMVRARAMVHANGRLVVVVDDDSHSIRPLAVSCVARRWALVQSVPPRAAPWEGSSSICLGLVAPAHEGASSLVKLVAEGAPDAGVAADDAFMLAANLRAIEDARQQARAAAETKKRAELDRGPVTIQDVRRLRRLGALAGQSADEATGAGGGAGGGAHAAGLLAGDGVHLCVHWRSSSGREGVALVPRVAVPPPPAAVVSIKHASSAVLARNGGSDSVVVRVDVTVRDASGLGLRGATLDVRSGGTFPAPGCWLGKRRQVLPDVPAHGEAKVVLAVRATSVGVFGVGPVVVAVGGSEFASEDGRLVVYEAAATAATTATAATAAWLEEDTMVMAESTDEAASPAKPVRRAVSGELDASAAAASGFADASLVSEAAAPSPATDEASDEVVPSAPMAISVPSKPASPPLPHSQSLPVEPAETPPVSEAAAAAAVEAIQAANAESPRLTALPLTGTPPVALDLDAATDAATLSEVLSAAVVRSLAANGTAADSPALSPGDPLDAAAKAKADDVDDDSFLRELEKEFSLDP